VRLDAAASAAAAGVAEAMNPLIVRSARTLTRRLIRTMMRSHAKSMKAAKAVT
jgi:hypothetical protein